MLSLNKISYEYNGTKVLSDITFTAKEGERIVLLGSNGSGKTTILKILDALLFAKSGEYVFEGRRIVKEYFRDKNASSEFRRSVVMLFQSPDVMLFNPTVFDEIAFGLRQIGKSQGEIKDVVNYWADRLHLRKYLDIPPFELSGGERQKVAIASILSINPGLILLDEPMANLDPRSQGELIDLLYEMPVTSIISTHNLNMALELGERALVLNEEHKLIYDGLIDDLLTNEEILIKANLVHSHRHKHKDVDHSHYHGH